MSDFASRADRDAIEAEMVWADRPLPATAFAMLAATAEAHGERPAVSFQLTSGPRDRAETLTWADYRRQVTRAANLFRRLGVGEEDSVAYLLPNCPEATVALVAGATAGVVTPINPLLSADQIAALLRETGARVLVTLKPFPRSDIADKAAKAARAAPQLRVVLEVDLARHLPPLARLAMPLLRPWRRRRHRAELRDFAAATAREGGDGLDFRESGDRVAARFHTGGTTGEPKLARHRFAGMIYNGWLGARLLFTPEDTILCPLPLFHVFACYPILMSALASGAQVVLPTPAGFRGDGVRDNFWKLVALWRASFVIAVPTAISALMQRPVDADVSSLRMVFSGSAPLPAELYERFRTTTGVSIVEGYGQTEATCLIACNPPAGEKKIGSVGLPLPYTQVRLLDPEAAEGDDVVESASGEIGEICVAGPGVFEGAGAAPGDIIRLGDEDRPFLRTGDLGRLDADGYLWITGRSKDLIIRGGNNIDPAVIEEALLAHRDVAGAAAIGQPDAVAGELPCAYVELVAGATVDEDALLAHCRARIGERAAVPKHIELLPALPTTAVGKIYKPDLRKRALARVYDAALGEAGHAAEVTEVIDDRQRGLVARLRATDGVDRGAVARTLAAFTPPWEWVA